MDRADRVPALGAEIAALRERDRTARSRAAYGREPNGADLRGECRNLCDLLIFVEPAARAVLSADLEGHLKSICNGCQAEHYIDGPALNRTGFDSGFTSTGAVQIPVCLTYTDEVLATTASGAVSMMSVGKAPHPDDLVGAGHIAAWSHRHKAVLSWLPIVRRLDTRREVPVMDSAYWIDPYFRRGIAIAGAGTIGLNDELRTISADQSERPRPERRRDMITRAQAAGENTGGKRRQQYDDPQSDPARE